MPFVKNEINLNVLKKEIYGELRDGIRSLLPLIVCNLLQM